MEGCNWYWYLPNMWRVHPAWYVISHPESKNCHWGKKCQAAMFRHVGFLVRTLSIAQSGKFWGFLGQITHEKGSSVDVEANETKCCPTNSKNWHHWKNAVFRSVTFQFSITRRNQKPLLGSIAYLVELLNTFPMMCRTLPPTFGHRVLRPILWKVRFGT